MEKTLINIGSNHILMHHKNTMILGFFIILHQKATYLIIYLLEITMEKVTVPFEE
jgi:hypothetical protein